MVKSMRTNLVDESDLFLTPDGSLVIFGKGIACDVSFGSDGTVMGDSVLELLLDPPLSVLSFDFIWKYYDKIITIEWI